MNLGTVESGSFEQYFQKPTPWVSIRGIGPSFDAADVKDALREQLDDEENEVNIAECRRKENGRVYVRFGMYTRLRDARRCSTAKSCLVDVLG